MDISKADWKLYRERVPDWQEHYMEKLTEEYVKLLTSPGHASDHFGNTKVDIENGKVDIQDKKVDIESVLSEKGSNFSVKTTVHIHRLLKSLALMRCLEEVRLWNFLLFGIYWGYAIYIYADVCVLFVWNFAGLEPISNH